MISAGRSVSVAGPPRVSGNAGLRSGGRSPRAPTAISGGQKLRGRHGTAGRPGGPRNAHGGSWSRCHGRTEMWKAERDAGNGRGAHAGRQSSDGRVRARALASARAHGNRSDGILRGIRCKAGLPAGRHDPWAATSAARSDPLRDREPVDLQRAPGTGAAAGIDQRAGRGVRHRSRGSAVGQLGRNIAGRRSLRRSVQQATSRTRRMSAAARKTVSHRMKKYWAERRKAQAKIK